MDSLSVESGSFPPKSEGEGGAYIACGDKFFLLSGRSEGRRWRISRV